MLNNFPIVLSFGFKFIVGICENMISAWITSSLSSRQVISVREVMDRLSQVPVVPPLESLRHVSLVLVCPDRQLQNIIGSFLLYVVLE